ncbi:MAG: hypothetical protein LC777_05520 [Actinobacteria bacterium]|nr:hypothetical protein [Actinomycetota bacterium]
MSSLRTSRCTAAQTGAPAPARSAHFTAHLRARSQSADGRLLPALRVATDDPAVAAIQTRMRMRASSSAAAPASTYGAEDGIEVSLRLWTPRGASVAVFSERAPARDDLRDRVIALDDRTIAWPAGRWPNGAREYALGLLLPAGQAGDRMLAARVALVADSEIVGRASVEVIWTSDETLAATCRTDGRGLVAPSVVAELPTGRSPVPRHVLGGTQPRTAPYCEACDLPAAECDRFCERCGVALGAAAQKS